MLLFAACPTPKNPKKSFNQLNLAKNRFQNADYAQAEVHALKAITYDPQSFEAHYLLGMIDLREVYVQKKILELDGCLTGMDATAHREEMSEFLGKARSHFKTAITLDSNYGQAYAEAGVVELLAQSPKAAIALLNQALLHPSRVGNLAQVRLNLGWAHFEDNSQIEALKELRQALQFAPNDCLINYRLGRVYFAGKEWEKALQYLSQAMTEECNYQEPYLYATRAYLELGRSAEAQSSASKCLSLGAKSCVANMCAAEGQ